MADDPEEDDIFHDLDPGIRARLMPDTDSEFQIGRGCRTIQSETSFMIFAKKRAKSTYNGYVDVTTLAPVMSPSGVRVLNTVVNPPIPKPSQFLQGDVGKQLEFLNHFSHGVTARRLLLTETLPHHDYERSLGAIADCLIADNQSVRRDAACRLERLLICTNYGAICAVKTQLLSVAQTTHEVIMNPVVDENAPDEEHLRMCGYLHLLAMAAMLCRAKHRPTIEECRPFMTWPKVKKQSGSDASQEVLKLMLAFYENFERILTKEQKTKNAVTVLSDNKKFLKASFSEQITTLFLSFNQIAEEGWSDKGLEQLTELQDIQDLISNKGKQLKPEIKAGLDLIFIRCLVVILNTTFAKVRLQIGEESYDHAARAAYLLAVVVKNVSQGPGLASVKEHLLLHLSTAMFHECPHVRQVVTEMLDLLCHPPLYSALDYLEAVVSVADFHVPRAGRDRQGSDCGAEKKGGTLQRKGAIKLKKTGSQEAADGLDPNCAWLVVKGRFGQESADCALLVHAGSCEARKFPGKECSGCRSGGSDSDSWQWQRHQQNLELLATLSPNKHLVQLLAFQTSPFLFYATECIKGNRLLEHLINHRAAHKWLSPAILCRITHDLISALCFLAGRDIASRDVTAYDILVTGRRRRGGRAGEITDVLMTEDFSVKLASLGLAHHIKQGDRKDSIAPVLENGPIPLLWTPPEALLKGEYCEKSMVYSAGCVMYELWTHGCQPFTTYQKSTADTIRMTILMPDSAPLIQWPCIPEEVYDVMKKCTASKANDRPSLKSLLQTFMEMHAAKKKLEETRGIELAGQRELTYPAFCDDQIARRHVPERGVPTDIQLIIDDYRTNHFESYRNMRRSRWVDYASKAPSAANSVEVTATHWLEIAYTEDYTLVREMLPAKFAQNELPLLESLATHAESRLPGLTEWLTDKQNHPKLIEDMADHHVHERRYLPAWTLQDATCKGILETSVSGYISMGMNRYIHVLLSLANAVHALHEAGWLHRDIRASSVLVDCQTGEVMLSRLGRMCQVTSTKNYFVNEAFEDSWRWLAPEVLSEGKYGRANDVFMLGTLFWEVYWAREVTERDPTATATNYLPFAEHDRSKVLALVVCGERLPKPVLCPDWLYELSVECRNPEAEMRPPMETIVRALEKRYTDPVCPTSSFLPHPKLLLDSLHHHRTSALEEEHDPVPELPQRFKSRHAAPYRDSDYDGEQSDDTASRVSSRSSTSLSAIKVSVSWDSSARAASGEYTDTDMSESGGESGGTVRGVEGGRGGGGSLPAAETSYLTPMSKGVQSVLKNRQSQRPVGGGRENDAGYLVSQSAGGGGGERGDERVEDVFRKPSKKTPPPCLPKPGRHYSDGDAASAAQAPPLPCRSKSLRSAPEPGQPVPPRLVTKLGLSHGPSDESGVLPGGRLFRNLPGGSLPEAPGKGGVPGVGRNGGMGPPQSRRGPLPPVPDDEHIYDDIKDRPPTSPKPTA